MTSENLYQALNGLDPALIEKSAPSEKRGINRRKRLFMRRWLPAAACVCLLAAAFYFVRQRQTPPVPGGSILYMNAECKTSTVVNGISVKYTGNPSSSSAESAPPTLWVPVWVHYGCSKSGGGDSGHLSNAE